MEHPEDPDMLRQQNKDETEAPTQSAKKKKDGEEERQKILRSRSRPFGRIPLNKNEITKRFKLLNEDGITGRGNDQQMYGGGGSSLTTNQSIQEEIRPCSRIPLLNKNDITERFKLLNEDGITGRGNDQQMYGGGGSSLTTNQSIEELIKASRKRSH